MPWFAVDDGFDTHPKVRKAGNAAAGLFCRLGAHCARHLTDGHVDRATVRDYGSPAQLAKLTTAGLLHAAGHDCPRCEQPEDGGYVLHDFLDYNRSRKQIEAARESGRRRQNKGRETQRAQRNATDSAANSRENSTQNERDSRENHVENEPHFEGPAAGQGGVSHRDTLQGATVVPSQPIPSPVPPTEVLASRDGALPRIGDRPRIPANARPLVDGITAAGLVVGWDLSAHDWFLIEALIQRCTIPVLVQHALAAAAGARGRIRSGSYFLPGWRSLPDVPATFTAPAALPAAAGWTGPTLSRSDQRVAAGLELAARLDAEETHR